VWRYQTALQSGDPYPFKLLWLLHAPTLEESCIYTTECISVFHTFLRLNIYIYLTIINQLAFVMEMECFSVG
jgi:hypothetical protein